MSQALLIGSFEYYENEKYYSNDNITFYYDEQLTKQVSKEDLESWAVFLNSPWSQTCERYIINVNCLNGYTKVYDLNKLWKCEYLVIAYDGLSTNIFGYGKTEEEALKECKKLFNYIQKTFNPENDSV